MKSFRIFVISAILAIVCAFALSSEAAAGSFRADFGYSIQGKTVKFSDRSIGLNLQNWFWDFGDRNTSSVKDPVHTYAGFGIYKVVLEVVTSTGNVSLKIQNVTLSRSNATALSFTPGEIVGLSLMGAGFVTLFVVRSSSLKLVMAIVGILGILVLLVTVSLGS